MNRFFITQSLKGVLDAVLTDADLVHQVSHVLRLRAGDELMLLDNSGSECTAVIQNIAKGGVVARITACVPNANEPKNFVMLYQSIIKKDKMEWVFEKCTEIGVSRFVPVVSAHSVKLGFQKERAIKIVKEAAEQSRRGILPRIEDIQDFSDAITRVQQGGAVNFIAHNIGAHQQLIEAARTFHSKNINMFVGPEGGFTDEEIAHAKENGFRVVSLGSRTLRAETAAVVASFLLVQ